MHRAVLLLLTLPALAFAPAPLPRRGGDHDRISLRYLQGKWKLVRNERILHNGERTELPGAGDKFFVRFAGSLWSHTERDGENDPCSNQIDVQAGHGAVAIDWYDRRDVKRQKKPVMVGLIRRRGNAVEILGYADSVKDQRPSSFEAAPANWWVMTLERLP